MKKFILVPLALSAVGCGLIDQNIKPGAVVAYDLNSCPQGYEEYALAYGRFIRGIDNSKNNIDPDGKRAAGSVQEDAVQIHEHNFIDRGIWKANGGGQGHSANNDSENKEKSTRSQTGRHSSETRPKNVALLYCKKL